ncbi:uncharacterized protein avpi1 [Genypterus blacodes]|uniref:uncharacterized protein avpi1 n=1 Tax=Genypterus blacodes TaxID=154954 RepID=UPI003F775258
MAEAPASVSTEDGLPVLWKSSRRRSRKSACSNIFTGVSLHQLHRLFRAAGDKDATQRARLVLQRMGAEMKGAEGKMEEEREGSDNEARLAQALVGLRLRARNKSGIRAEGHRDQKRLKASGYLRSGKPLSDYIAEDQGSDPEPSPGTSLFTNEEVPEKQSPLKVKPCSWRMGAAKQQSAKDSEPYLHHIRH